MSTKGIRDFRPELHFTPKSGWINDPNGLVYADGKYHLFAQYYPEPQWGPMHWYNATSTDLIHWEHQSSKASLTAWTVSISPSMRETLSCPVTVRISVTRRYSVTPLRIAGV